MPLILIRHGQTSSNVAGLLDTAIPGAVLTPLGEQQAGALPRALAGEAIEAVYASTAVRAQQTAAPLAAACSLPVLVRGGIREISAGDGEMLGTREAVQAYIDGIVAWAYGDLDARIPGGESGREAFARFDAVIEEIVASGSSTVALVSHGAMLRSWLGLRATNVDGHFIGTHPITNTGVIVVTGDPGLGWTVETWTGDAVGGPDLTTDADGPAAEVERGF
ncbi:MAG TPA: histidine phosphatase family protein [Plantibacter sp.]|uniref:histidine phosphatase family protein n=1 Tax=unclassified Plantibacter TaxID=2624265 RepID=UPI002D0E9E4B|nr:histidine phosphatase family protein [Plantibacter sp.]